MKTREHRFEFEEISGELYAIYVTFRGIFISIATHVEKNIYWTHMITEYNSMLHSVDAGAT